MRRGRRSSCSRVFQGLTLPGGLARANSLQGGSFPGGDEDILMLFMSKVIKQVWASAAVPRELYGRIRRSS